MRISCECTHAHRVGGRKSLYLVIHCKTLNLAASLITQHSLDHIRRHYWTSWSMWEWFAVFIKDESLQHRVRNDLCLQYSASPWTPQQLLPFLDLEQIPRAHTRGLEKSQPPCLCNRDHMRHTVLDTSQSSLDSLGWGISLIIYILQTRDRRQGEF